jgi:MFS family permease
MLSHKLGPIQLAPGVLPRHVLCYLFAAFISIGLFTYLIALTPYILRVNLGLPEADHGRISGDLQFWHEIVALAVIGWWGAMSDRFGRRIIYIIGFVILGIAYATYSFATSEPELIIYRLIFAAGIAATAALMSAILADYPAEQSRGKLTGVAFFLNGIGSVIFFVGLTRLPEIYASGGADDLWAGRYAYLSVAGLAFIAAIVMLGLKPGRPAAASGKPRVRQLMLEGLRAGRNPRIGVSYVSSIAARADMSIITIFLTLWVVNAGIADGATTAEATARAGMTVGIAQLSAVIWAPIFGHIADRIDRLLLLIIAFALATTGYGWVSVQTDILSMSSLPALICLGMGQSSAILAATVLLGQEAPANIRGSAFGMQSLFGSVGILLISVIGGRLYDSVGPHAPFYAITVANGIVFLAGLYVRAGESRAASKQTR